MAPQTTVCCWAESTAPDRMLEPCELGFRSFAPLLLELQLDVVGADDGAHADGQEDENELEEGGRDEGRNAERKDIPPLQVLTERFGDLPAGKEARGVEQDQHHDVQHDEPHDPFAEQEPGDQQEIVDQVHQADGKHHVEGWPEGEAETVAVTRDQPGHGGRQQHRESPDQDLRDVEDKMIAVLFHNTDAFAQR